MSLYNMIAGYNPASFFVLPLLGQHPDEYPRFRDCFLEWEDGEIVVLTRVGGGNREDYEDAIQELQDHPSYLRDEDADYDNTYAYFYFTIPDGWREDLRKLVQDEGVGLSDAYWEQLNTIYPKLKEKFAEIRAGWDSKTPEDTQHENTDS